MLSWQGLLLCTACDLQWPVFPLIHAMLMARILAQIFAGMPLNMQSHTG